MSRRKAGPETNMTTWRVGKLAMLLAMLPGCATAPTDDRPVFSWKWEVAMTDSCEKLAGLLATMDLLDMLGMDQGAGAVEVTAQVRAEMARRCPDDVEPEALDTTISIPTIACTDLRNLVAMANAFGIATLPRDKREMAEELLDDLDSEIEKRCPPLD